VTTKESQTEIQTSDTALSAETTSAGNRLAITAAAVLFIYLFIYLFINTDTHSNKQ